MAIQILRPDDKLQWEETVAKCFQIDFYYLPQYQSLAEQQREGKTHLFVYTNDCYLLALPLLIRPISEISGLVEAGSGWSDATSSYGYAGPIASHPVFPPSVIEGFQHELRSCLEELRVVTVFSRLHPLIDQSGWIESLGVCRDMGRTVSIDLTEPIEAQYAKYRPRHKQGIAKLLRSGLRCVVDEEKRHLRTFIQIYHENMQRVGASDYYFFSEDYFKNLVLGLPDTVHLVVALNGEEVAAGGLFTTCNGIVQYHLSATHADFLTIAPMKMIIDHVRVWATERGMNVFHLGGGLGAKEDSLLLFKLGFSSRTHPFRAWQWTILPDIERGLQNEKQAWDQLNGVTATSTEYFPWYRAPRVACQNI